MAQSAARRKISSKKNLRAKKISGSGSILGIRSGYIDLPFLLIIMILLVLGIVMMFSASYVWAIDDVKTTGGDGTYYVKKQLFAALLGLICMFVLSYVDYHILQKKIIAIGFYLVCLVLLVLVLFIGVKSGGARRWLYIGTNFQPSELMKLAIVILFAYLIAQNKDRMNKFFVGIIPFLCLLAPVVFLMMMQPHLSGTILICSIAVVLIFVGGAKISQLLAMGGVGIAGLIGIVLMKSSEGYTYFATRLYVWRHPFEDMHGDSWQTCQSLIAIGSGGLFGLGLGNSRQKFLYLPETKNDFVFSIVCEELGFIGAMMVIILFTLFVFRGFYIASKSQDEFGMMLAVGLTIQIGLQAFLNMAVVTNSIPNTGISLPFFSYGGTALLLQLAEMGVLLNISRQASMEK